MYGQLSVHNQMQNNAEKLDKIGLLISIRSLSVFLMK